MKRMFATLFLATMAMLVSGTVALACDTVTTTITDSSTGDEYTSGGVLMLVDNSFVIPIVGTDINESGDEHPGKFSVTVKRNIGNAKAVITLYRPEGKSPLPPIIRDVANMNNTPGVCLNIVETVDSGVYTTMRPGGIITF